MSNDLISRSALLEEFLKEKEFIQKGIGKDAEYAYMSADFVMHKINSQPTAYDVDKVVDRINIIFKHHRANKTVQRLVVETIEAGLSPEDVERLQYTFEDIIEKIITELEEMKNPMYREDGSIMAQKTFIKIDKAIEIVKQFTS